MCIGYMLARLTYWLRPRSAMLTDRSKTLTQRSERTSDSELCTSGQDSILNKSANIYSLRFMSEVIQISSTTAASSIFYSTEKHSVYQLKRKPSFHPRIKAALPALSLAPASSVQVPFGDDPTLSVSLGHYSGLPGSTRRPYAEVLLSQKVQWHAKRSWLRHERPN